MIRRVSQKDLPQILSMYKNIFNVDMDQELYNYWYFNSEFGEYDSFVFVSEGEVLGHNALIRKCYEINSEQSTVAISSGGMVKSKSSGIFFKILQESFAMCNCEAIIAFPNKNSIGFFTRLFGFSEVKETYFSTQEKVKTTTQSFLPIIKRTDEFLKWRIKDNPQNDYLINEIEDLKVITKEYSDKELDIIFSNSFDQRFINFLNKKLLKFERINIIHWDKTFIKSIGFKSSSKYNSFVLKGDIDIDNFQFQMIDSDVF